MMKRISWFRLALVTLLILSLLCGTAFAAPVSLTNLPEDANIVIRSPFDGLESMVLNQIESAQLDGAWTETLTLSGEGKEFEDWEGKNVVSLSFGMDEAQRFAIAADLADVGQYGLKFESERMFLKIGNSVFSLDYAQWLPILSKLIRFQLPTAEIMTDTFNHLPDLLVDFLMNQSGFTVTTDADRLAIDFSSTDSALVCKALETLKDWLAHYQDESTKALEQELENAISSMKQVRSTAIELHFALDTSAEGKGWTLNLGIGSFAFTAGGTENGITGTVTDGWNSYEFSGKLNDDSLQFSVYENGMENGQKLVSFDLSWKDEPSLNLEIGSIVFTAKSTENGLAGTVEDGRRTYEYALEAGDSSLQFNLSETYEGKAVRKLASFDYSWGKDWSLNLLIENVTLTASCIDGIINGKMVNPRTGLYWDFSGEVIGETLNLNVNSKGYRYQTEHVASINLSWGDVKRLQMFFPDEEITIDILAYDENNCLRFKGSINGNMYLYDARLKYEWDEASRTMTVEPEIDVAYIEYSGYSGDRYIEMKLRSDSIEYQESSSTGRIIAKYLFKVTESTPEHWKLECSRFDPRVSLDPDKLTPVAVLEALASGGMEITLRLDDLQGSCVKLQSIFEELPFEGFPTDKAVAITAESVGNILSLIGY